jgi:hypothetical protein
VSTDATLPFPWAFCQSRGVYHSTHTVECDPLQLFMVIRHCLIPSLMLWMTGRSPALVDTSHSIAMMSWVADDRLHAAGTWSCSLQRLGLQGRAALLLQASVMGVYR